MSPDRGTSLQTIEPSTLCYMRPVPIHTRPSGTLETQSNLSCIGDIYMYGFSMADAMINPKNCEKSEERAEECPGELRKLTNYTDRDRSTDSKSSRANHHHQYREKARRLYCCRSRDRHERRLNRLTASRAERRQEDQTLPKMRVPLVPPKPKEFFTATSIFMSRAALAQ